MAGLWRKNPRTPGGKYLVKRRDGTIPEWAWFVLGAADEAAPAGLRGYADKCEELGLDPQYVADVREMADAWEHDLAAGKHKKGDPDAPRHRRDDPATVAEMGRATVAGGGSA
jgi:hypothetical protein